MKPIFWTPEALARLEDIQAYIANDAPIAAHEVIAGLLARSRQLETAPLSGRIVPEYPRDDLRELLERHYRIVTASPMPASRFSRDALPPAIAARGQGATAEVKHCGTVWPPAVAVNVAR